MEKRQPIGIELVRRGIVSGDDIEKALKFQMENKTKKLGDVLYILKLADPHVLIKNIAEILGQKGMILDDNTVKLNNITEYIPLDTMKNNRAVPFDIENGRIKICFADVPNQVANMNSIKLLMLNRGLVIEPYITFDANMQEYLEKLESRQMQNIDDLGKTDSVTELIDSIIKHGIEKRASDIHVEPQADSVRIRYRIDGELFVVATIEKAKQAQMIGRLKAISNMHQEKQDSQDGRIIMYENYNIRVSSQRNIYGEKFVLRLLKKNSNIRNIFELGFPYDEVTLNKTVNKRNSITIITAPTGEGKTTTLYSILDYLKNDAENITTIEDPVEIRIPGLNQIEIEKNVRFADALRTILRQDPDIILVGEIRDKETAEIAIQAGQTGHYVLSTIHTINSVEAITRLRKMGISDYDISSTLATSISQRLVRRLCPKCKKQREFTEKEKEYINNIGNKYNVKFDTKDNKTYDAVGCEYCNNSGYYERVAIYEILNIDETLKELIMEGKSSIEIRKKALELGFKPLIVDAIQKIIDGTTNFKDIDRKLLISNNN